MKCNRKLIFEDGWEYLSQAFGAAGERVCEIVFNTSPVGYQEILSDPSYTDQAVVMTYPLYAVIVSGYSGSDIVAEQLISSLNMNKSFFLPPEFAMIRTANDPGSIALREHIREDAEAFGKRMIAQLRGSTE